MNSSSNGVSKIMALILDLDGTLLNTEKATNDILKEFLEIYGKVVDRDKEDKRLGMMHMESVTSILKDYDLPLTPEQFSTNIMPLYHKKNILFTKRGVSIAHIAVWYSSEERVGSFSNITVLPDTFGHPLLQISFKLGKCFRELDECGFPNVYALPELLYFNCWT